MLILRARCVFAMPIATPALSASRRRFYFDTHAAARLLPDAIADAPRHLLIHAAGALRFSFAIDIDMPLRAPWLADARAIAAAATFVLRAGASSLKPACRRLPYYHVAYALRRRAADGYYATIR